VRSIYANIALLIPKAKLAIEENKREMFGELMNFNQGYLESLGVGSQKLSQMIYAARTSGAYGAKLSGAGGGDCMIAVSSQQKEEKVKKAIEVAGGKILPVKTHAMGVKIEYGN
jgi:mevalonate kinase